MRKWTAAVMIAAVLVAAGCRGKAQETAGGAGAGATASGGSAGGGASAGNEETVPGGFTVDTQKVENLEHAGQTVNEPD